MNLKVIFVCYLATPAWKRYYGAVQRPSAFAASMEAMWHQGIETLNKAFASDVVEMTRLFQDYLYDPRQFDSVKDLYSNYRHFVFLAGRQLDPRSFTDLVKRIEAFPATECVCIKISCQLLNLACDFRHQMSDSMIIDLLIIKARIIWSDAAQIKVCTEILG
jgi:hypothetical protein